MAVVNPPTQDLLAGLTPKGRAKAEETLPLFLRAAEEALPSMTERPTFPLPPERIKWRMTRPEGFRIMHPVLQSKFWPGTIVTLSNGRRVVIPPSLGSPRHGEIEVLIRHLEAGWPNEGLVAPVAPVRRLTDSEQDRLDEARERDRVAELRETEREREKRQRATRTAVSVATRLDAELLDETDLEETGSPRWLVGGLLRPKSVARIIGAGGTYKSFLALSLAHSVARGVPWFGREVEQGNIVYVAAEAPEGAGARSAAYRELHGLDHATQGSFALLGRSIIIGGPEWEGFIELCSVRKASLIILDTQAKMTAGMDENSASATSQWLAAVERLRSVTRACVVLVHHNGHDNGTKRRGRGSSAAYAGIDTEVLVEKDGELSFRLQVIRQKDGKEWPVDRWVFGSLVPAGESVAIERVGEPGERKSSASADAKIPGSAEAKGHSVRLARVLFEGFNASLGASETELRTAYLVRMRELGHIDGGGDIARSTWSREWNALRRSGCEEHPAMPGRYRLSLDGSKAAGVPHRAPAWSAPTGA
jgi:hypothetical protein